MEKRTENIILALVVVAVMGAFAFAIQSRPIADQVVVMAVSGINCGVISDIETNLYAQKGVAAVAVNPNEGNVTIGYDSAIIQSNSIAATMMRLGYEIQALKQFDIDTFNMTQGSVTGTKLAVVGCGGACGVKSTTK